MVIALEVVIAENKRREGLASHRAGDELATLAVSGVKVGGMKRQTKIIVVVLLAYVAVGLTAVDRHVTAARNLADRQNLQHVKLGMTEEEVVRIMGIKPVQMGTDPRQKEIFVWERETVTDSILSPHNPITGRTITIVDSRVVSIRADLILR